MRPFEQLPFDAVPDRPRKSHAYFSARSDRVRVRSRSFGEIDVHVTVHGAGPPLLLVHGFMTSSYSFRYLLEPLGRSFTCFAPDLPGSGRSDKPDVSYLPEHLSATIGDIVGALGIRGAPAIGNSLGGYLMMRLALSDPGASSRLVNLHSPGLPTARMRALGAALTLVPDPEPLLRRLVWRSPERWVHRNVHYFDESLKSREEHAEYAAPLRTPEGLRAFARMLTETLDVGSMAAFERELRRLGRFPVPLLLVYAATDPMVPPSVGDRLRKLLPDAGFVRLENASHFAHVDATDRFVEAVLPFLRGAA
jgi:pimeloyl-ACP methyl ester carboxylesterase